MYFWTLSVENCGASGMPITRFARDACMSRAASAMNGFQLRMPTATGTSSPVRRSSIFNAAACCSVMSVSGERPPMARQLWLISSMSSGDGSRPPRTSRR